MEHAEALEPDRKRVERFQKDVILPEYLKTRWPELAREIWTARIVEFLPDFGLCAGNRGFEPGFSVLFSDAAQSP